MQVIYETGEVFFTPARLVSLFEVQCDMPFSIVDIEITWTSITWLVSVSNDNVTFSNQTSVFVFDSKCLVCNNGSSTCQLKVSQGLMRTDSHLHFLQTTEKQHCHITNLSLRKCAYTDNDQSYTGDKSSVFYYCSGK